MSSKRSIVSGEDRGGAESKNSRLASMLREALSIEKVAEVDSILDRPLPQPQSLPARPAPNDNEVLAGTGGLVGQRMTVSRSERMRIHADVYGRQAPEQEEMERRVAAVEDAVFCMREEDKRALMEATRRNPLLVSSSSHIRLFQNKDDFDAMLVAERLARYWRQREAMFGEDAYTDGVFSALEEYDYLRFYEKSVETVSNPNVDEMTKELAMEYISSVNKAKVAAFDRVLANIPPSEKSAFVAVQRRCAGAVGSDDYKIQFLRVNDFAVEKAVKCMLRYWKVKLDLFGPDALHRKITIDDFDEGSHLELGLCRLMPNCDEFGRAVIVVMWRKLSEAKLTERNCLQALWYVVHAAMESWSCQEKGVVIFSDFTSLSWDLFQKSSSIRKIFREFALHYCPLKLRALHLSLWHHDWRIRILGEILSVAGAFTAGRIVVHVKTEEVFVSELQTFGVGLDLIPCEMGGNVAANYWSEWVKERIAAGL